MFQVASHFLKRRSTNAVLQDCQDLLAKPIVLSNRVDKLSWGENADILGDPKCGCVRLRVTVQPNVQRLHDPIPFKLPKHIPMLASASGQMLRPAFHPTGEPAPASCGRLQNRPGLLPGVSYGWPLWRAGRSCLRTFRFCHRGSALPSD